ncbi:ribokinase [Anoxybacter fermentans]|uniref:Ribokinase n=1 Tax=Anoxybacter fermentans TaxID=1323375 RepID=A0A3Q9HR29_9FIRM|nr:ribokinase [Anoxybacter fermentans]AZR73752.1 ribokinase [Anoxybacter fermentans]
MKNDILVVGSMNMDLVVQTDRYPKKGETIIGNDFKLVPGGKGSNQALTIGKLGGNVSFIGACGKDYFGDILLSSLKKGGVNTDAVYRLEESTGIAAITIEKNGDNRIIIVQGANSKLTPEMIDTLKNKISRAKIVLLQLEVPLETVIHTIELAHQYNTKVILDPAPARKLPENIYHKIDYLLPNEGELDLLLKDYNLPTLEDKVAQLLDWGVGAVLVTRGEKGISLYTKGMQKTFEAIKVEVVDTTAAGDAFAGAFSLGLYRNWSIEESINYARIVAALTVTKLGAQSSLPDISEVEKFKKEKGL